MAEILQPEETWPQHLELERWLMNSAKDTDPGSLFLRRILNMNPAYGAYLASDTDLAQIVQLFAKRIRLKVQQAESPLKPSVLYEPLCEITWRVVGHVLHAIIELENNHTLPVPKEPLGQVKMLLQSNMELSRTLNSSRRAYLRELTEHRDKQRTLSSKTLKALESLREYPVMFFEPLCSILDETTKEFVRACVEERVKLEMRSPEAKVIVPQVESDGDRLDASLSRAQSEIRQLRSSLSREQELRKYADEEIARLREQALSGSDTASLQEIERLRSELSKSKESIAEYERGGVRAGGDETLASMQSKLEQSEAALLEAKNKIAELERELSKSAEDGQKKAQIIHNEAASNGLTSDDSLQKQLADHLKIERELRDANRALEKALAAERKKKNQLSHSAGDTESDVQDAIRKATEAQDKLLREQEEELKRLRQQQNSIGKSPSHGDGDWKDKYRAMKAEKEDLENEVSALQQQFSILIDKLRAIGGDKAVREVEEKIRLTPAAAGKKRRKNAFERLYEDAQRRIITLRTRQEALIEEQDRLIREAMLRIRNKKSLFMVQNLTHLQKAAVASQSRFTDALAHFTDENPPLPGDPAFEVEGEEDDLGDLIPFLRTKGYGSSRFRGKWEIDYNDTAAIEQIIFELRQENRQLAQELLRAKQALLNGSDLFASGIIVHGQHLVTHARTTSFDETRPPSSPSRSRSPSDMMPLMSPSRSRSPTVKRPPHEPIVLSSRPCFPPLSSQNQKAILHRARTDSVASVDYASSLNSSLRFSQTAPLPRRGAEEALRTSTAPAPTTPLGLDAPWRKPMISTNLARSRQGFLPQNSPPSTAPGKLLPCNFADELRLVDSSLNSTAPCFGRKTLKKAGTAFDISRPTTSTALSPLQARSTSSSPERLQDLQRVMYRSAPSLGMVAQQLNEKLGQHRLKSVHLPLQPQQQIVRKSAGKLTMPIDFKAPVKPLPQGFCVTALRSQESLSNISTQAPTTSSIELPQLPK